MKLFSQLIEQIRKLYDYVWKKPRNSLYNILILPFTMYRFYHLLSFGIPDTIESNEFTRNLWDTFADWAYTVCHIVCAYAIFFRYIEQFNTNSFLVDLGTMIVVMFGIASLITTAPIHYRNRFAYWKAVQLANQIDMELVALGFRTDYARQHKYMFWYITGAHIMFMVILALCELPLFELKSFNLTVSFVKLFTTASVHLNFGIHILYLALNSTRLGKLNEAITFHFDLADRLKTKCYDDNMDQTVEVKRFTLIFHNINEGLAIVNNTLGHRIMYTFVMVSIYILFMLFQVYRMFNIRTLEYFYDTMYCVMYGILYLDRICVPLYVGSIIKDYVRRDF